MIILEFLRVGDGFIMSRSSGKVANWSTEIWPCVELLSRFWEILAKNKIISRKVRVKSGPESDSNTIKKKGDQVSEICKIIGHSAYHAALTKTMLGEFLDQAGCI